MSLTPRISDLLGRYPDELTDAELTELRAAAEQDPTLDATLSEILELDSAIAGIPAPPTELSPDAQRRLDLAVRTTKAWGSSPAAPLEAKVQAPPVETTKNWGSSPAAPLEAQHDNVVSLFARRPVQLALAALLLVGLGFLSSQFLNPIDPYGGGTKGDDDSAAPLQGQLILQPPGEPRLQDDSEQPIDAPIHLSVRLEDPAFLALIEVQGDVSAVVWPLPGAVWTGVVGVNLLQPPDASADYRPASSGAATYLLIGSEDPLLVPSRRISEDAFFDANPDALLLDRRRVLWTDPSPESP